MTIEAALFSLAVATQAPSEVDRQGCRDDEGVDRCAAEQQARVRASFDVPSAETLRSQGVIARRAFAVNGYGRDMPMVAFSRAPGDSPRVSVRVLRNDRSFASADGFEELSAPVSRTLWNEVLRRTRYADRALAPRARTDDEPPSICLHAWGGTVELVEPGERGHVRSRTDSGCDDSPTKDAVFFLADSAVAALPACAAIERDQHRNALAVLQACAHLEGDRVAAAEAMNQFETPWFAEPNRPEHAAAIAYLFHERATIDWVGEPQASGTFASAEAWVRKLATSPRHRFRQQRFVGETADRVRVEGRMLKAVDPQADRIIYDVAPVTMIWTRENGFDFRVRSVTVGDFRREDAAP